MTSPRPTSRWSVAVGWWFAGSLLTVITFVTAASVGTNLANKPGGSLAVELLTAAGIGLAVFTAMRLPRRARAMFVAGIFMPIVLGAALFVWLIWALSQSNLTF